MVALQVRKKDGKVAKLLITKVKIKKCHHSARLIIISIVIMLRHLPKICAGNYEMLACLCTHTKVRTQTTIILKGQKVTSTTIEL